jgi:hypothetical protein
MALCCGRGLLGFLVAILSAQALLNAAPAANAPPGFHAQVAPILAAHCAKCHQPNQIASSVSFETYVKARAWAKAIREKVLLREMPPWPADPRESAPFSNDARLSAGDIRTLVSWVDAGAPPGDESHTSTTSAGAEGWLHPDGVPPDAIILLPETSLPATGTVPYVTHLVKVPFAEDRWITAIQVRPGNGAAVHHMAITEVRAEPRFGADTSPLAVFARKNGFNNDAIPRQPAVAVPGEAGVYDMLGVYTPGQPFESYGDDTAKFLKGGTGYYLNVNIHYQTTGKPAKDQSALGLWFQPRPPKHQLFRLNGAAESLIVNGRESLNDDPGEKAEGNAVAIPPIPPGKAGYEIIGMTAYTTPVTIYQLQPHAHLRGKDFTYTVVYDDGREQNLLKVRRFDFHWQLAYDLQTPLALPAGSKLVVTAHYDNSPNNPNNPAAGKEVLFLGSGNQSWDEMFTPFIQFAIGGSDPPARASIVSTTGCLEADAGGEWRLDNAGEPVASAVQSASAAGIRAAAVRPPGDRHYHLVGVRFFNPGGLRACRVAVQGALTNSAGESRINVTSLQKLAPSCMN